MSEPVVESSSVQQPTPQYIRIRTSDGRAVRGLSAEEPRLVAGTEEHLFGRVHVNDQWFALRSLTSGKYLAIAHDHAKLSGDAIGDAETFSLAASASGLLQLSDGARHLSAPAGDDATLTISTGSVTAAERFDIEVVDLSPLAEGQAHGCCTAWGAAEAPADESLTAGVTWNDVTHEVILKMGLWGMDALTPTNPDVKRFWRFWANDQFATAAFKGLHDADYEWPWRGDPVIGDIHTWHDHFYNPDTGRNYRGDVSNALTEVRRWFNLSVHEATRILQLGDAATQASYTRAGYCLGLALHFLTDLTQPMHAANFANAWGEDGNYLRSRIHLGDKRHSGFEDYAEGRVKNGYFDSRPVFTNQDLATDGIESVASFVHDTARARLWVFKNLMLEVLRRKNPNRRTIDNSWKPEEAEPVLERSLRVAPLTVARFLTYWSACVNRGCDVDPRYWYVIREPTKDQFICLQDGYFVRQVHDDARRQVFVMFNADGTWSFGSRADNRSLWWGHDSPNGYWLSQNGDGPSPNETARFRVVRDAAPARADDRVWIFESEQYVRIDLWSQAVTVAQGRYEGRVTRANPVEPGLQLFRLVKGELISDDDVKAIRKTWPDFQTIPWYGKP